MKLARKRARVILCLTSFGALSACATDPSPPPEPLPPELVQLEIPAALLRDVPSDSFRSVDTIADLAAYIVDLRGIIARANDQFYAARRIQNCNRRLIDGGVETCQGAAPAQTGVTDNAS